ncbi:MAG: FkbM family methyltransferase [Candidatus Marinimicrobia bacterium]|nr:FkbM family methyltransferase [Candidatus Neomarinimicrobiota bacterium]
MTSTIEPSTNNYRSNYTMKNIFTILSALLKGQLKGHTGQWAEDVVVRKLFLRSKKQGIYVDLGAHHPFTHSNTAWLWFKGWRGINVDANRHSITLFNKSRPNDTNLNLAIIPSSQYTGGTRAVDLYLPDEESCETGDHGITATASVDSDIASERNFQKTEKVDAIDVLTLFKQHHLTEIDYLNIDVEGLDFQILQDIDYNSVKIHAISVEDYCSSIHAAVESETTKYLQQHGYDLVSRVGPTSIFALRESDRLIRNIYNLI